MKQTKSTPSLILLLIAIIIAYLAASDNHVEAAKKQDAVREDEASQTRSETVKITRRSTNDLEDNNDPTSYFAENSLSSLFDQRTSFDQYITYSMRSLALVAGFDNDLHRYDLRQDLINSFARNLSYTDDLVGLKAHIDTTERALLDDQSELTLIENQINQAQCGEHLDKLIELAQNLFRDPQTFSTSKQLKLIEFIDSFGSVSPLIMQGNLLWLGSHEQCSRNNLIGSSAEFGGSLERTEMGARYCVANFRSPNWNLKPGESIDRSGSKSIKLGVCLPKSCNSISILRHKQRIETLVRVARFNQTPFSSYKLTHLFCLPDESSPLRQFSLSAKAFMILLSSWLTIVAYFSIKYEYLRMNWLQSGKKGGELADFADNRMKIFAFRLSCEKLFESDTRSYSTKKEVENKVLENDFGKAVDSESGIECSDSESTGDSTLGKKSSELNLFRASNIDNGMSNDVSTKAANILEALKSVSTRTTEVTAHRHPVNQISKNKTDIIRVSSEQQRRDRLKDVNHELAIVLLNSTNQESKPAAVDLSVVDGIKVLSMIWLISAHTLLFFIRTMANGRDFWSVLKDARFMTIMAGIFPVDTFFTITGLLTAFLKFNKNDGQAMGKVKYWMEAFLHRYFRFIPMYLLVFWYTRDVSEYIGSGPLWDYATADTSLRSVCKQESVTVPLFFQANFKPIDQHCVKPAWYLANDYQYLLVTPFFMMLILKSRLLGYSVIGLSIAISLVLQFLTVFYSTEMDDFGAIINFKPLFGTYILKNLWKLYVLPYNRIPPYLIGIVTGHLIYSLSKESRRQKEKNINSANETKETLKVSSLSQHSLTSLDQAAKHHHESTSNILKNSQANKRLSWIKLIGVLKVYICLRIWTPLVFLISIIYLPMITRLSTQEGLAAKIGTSSIIALMRFIWSISIARLIYICATTRLNEDHASANSNNDSSFIIRFLSSPKWKPWSKIGLSALLIQWEIISYLAQTQTSAPIITITFLLAIILVCIVATYSLALLIYLTIEYPLSQVEQLYIHPAFFHKT